MDETPYMKRRIHIDETGRCMNCDRKAVPGNMRCQVHININAARSMAWRLAHPRARSQAKALIRAQGRCDICPEHRPLTNGKLHCDPCLERFKGYYHDRRAFGLCGHLGCPNKSGEACYCKEHADKRAQDMREKKQAIQEYVYGGSQ
jgi:hypothetical protein